ncbi:uncharacterized protein [Periplaneta americana]|uniref:uncharacterized protein isoform X5 n=1 Tax=Periplaneta americana TaxID=6978 RepID=UPI0037E94568
MPLFNQPVRLEKLSLHSLAKYLSDICVRLVNSASFEEAHATCQRLKCIIHDRIPHSMANCVTSKALKYLNSRYDDISESCYFSPLSDNILQQFVAVILHPKVTELDIIGIKLYIAMVVLSGIEKLSQLKIFRACGRYRRRLDSFNRLLLWHLPSLKNLKCCTLPLCSSNEIIRVLFKSAPGLTHLDVSESEGVTDESIDIILSFPYLQSLDVSGTGISQNGYKCLLDKSRRCLHLQDFGVNIVDSSHILSLPDCFQGLRRLSLNMGILEMNHLDDIAQLLQGLEELKICGSYVISLPYFPSLKVLVLDVDQLDVEHLPTKCPRLEKLVIETFGLECSRITNSFMYLTSLSIWFVESHPIDVLLSAAPNLVTLFLAMGPDFYLQISIVQLFSRPESHKLNRLENLSIYKQIRYVRPETLSFIMQSCSRLRTCKVFGENHKMMKSYYKDCAGVNISEPKRCWDRLYHISLSECRPL